MPIGNRRSSFVIVALVAMLIGAPLRATAQTPQPSYAVLRIEQDGTVMPYNIWVDWMPLVIATPDGGAWAFFSAQAKKADRSIGTRRLYAARFDPSLGVWLPGKALPGGEIQFGPAAAVDSQGVVHLVYSDRLNGDQGVYASLVYTKTDGQGGWTKPAAVAPDPNAGHQMMPSLAVGAGDRLVVAWRDQRSLDPDSRAASSINADVFASDLVDGTWSAPTQINRRPGPDVNSSWPYVSIDGERVIAIWSVYSGPEEAQAASATRVEWSTRPIGDQKRWSAPQVLFEKGDSDKIGGRLLDVGTNPQGGTSLIYGRIKGTENTLLLRQLPAGATEWGSDLQLNAGDTGFVPSVGIGPDGTNFIVYTHGRGDPLEVGGQVLKPGATDPSGEVLLTQGEDGLQGRPAIDVGPDGKAWVIYMHQNPGSPANEMRVLRGANLGG